MTGTKPDLRVEVKPTLKSTEKRLKKRIGQIGDLTVPNKKAAIFLDQWVQKNFRSEGGFVGGWKGIQRAGKILQDTGRLRASFAPFSDEKDAGIGSDLPYSKVHEKGLGVAPRRMLPNHDEVSADLFKIYNTHVGNLTRRPV